VPCTYVTTKRAADAEVARAHLEGQHVVTVHPGFMLGPWDWNPSSGKMIQALQSPLLLSPSGGCSVCDPRDVASTILNAIDLAQNGRHYILAGENLTYLDLWRRISSKLGTIRAITHLRPPERFVAAQICNLMRVCTGKERDVNSASITMSSQFHWYSSQRAVDELGYRFRSADDSISSAVQWLRDRGMIRR
jgi:dihydroflavonol-4-reductase